MRYIQYQDIVGRKPEQTGEEQSSISNIYLGEQ